MASTSSSTLSDDELNKKWDAFISFRGKDIRQGFLSHLVKALQQKQINIFMDENLCKGEDISPALLETIEDSYVSIVIFSENYADSPWCLDELVKIHECKETSRQMVLPVFYKVDPADVQDLSGNFGKAFDKLKEECKDCLDKVDGWCRALIEISCLSGWDYSRNIKSEGELIEEIVSDVWRKLSHLSLSDSDDDNLVGINSRVHKVESLLRIDLVNEQRIVGIWGMGGIGKTTLAKKVFSRIMDKFDGHYFAANVKDEIRKENPIVLQAKIIGQLLGENIMHNSAPCLCPHIRRRLKSKRVLIVFDDVDYVNHLEDLAGVCGLFHKGSRILVTSRDRQVLKNVCSAKYIYEVEKLIFEEALELFSLYAFKQKHPEDGYLELSEKVIAYGQGIPLALQVLGANLYDKSTEVWESELEKVKSIPNMKIQEILRISYDELDRHEKNIFLDIACFFKGKHRDEVERILEALGFFPKSGISCLIDKSLITIDWPYNRLGMHDLLQQMGMEIVHEECKHPGGRSRLWNSKEIFDVLTTDMGTENVEGILLDLREIGHMLLNRKTFVKMPNMRFLKFCDDTEDKMTEKVLLPNGLEYLPYQLRYLYWIFYPLKSLPLKFCPRNLVELHMPNSKLEQLWDGDINKPLGNLKVMNLCHSKCLIRISDLSAVPSLEKLTLSGCTNLIEIPPSLQYLRKLKELCLWRCLSLCNLPSCLHLENLEVLNLLGCSKLKECPEIPHSIKDIDLRDTTIEQLPSSIGNCSRLCTLWLSGCTRLACLPQSICHLKSLMELDISECLDLNGLPDNIGELESLKTLRMRRSGIKTLPSSINQLRKLKFLTCAECEGLTKLPSLISLSCLEKVDITGSGILELPESVGSLASLRSLYLRNCKGLRHIPKLPSRIKKLDASNCTSLESVSCSLLLDYKFDNCINLNHKIVEDVLERHLVGKKVELRIPGSEVPQQMRYQNSGSSLSCVHDPDHIVIGFSCCIILDPKFDGGGWNIVAELLDEFEHITKFCYTRHWFSNSGWDSEHIFLSYIPLLSKEVFVKASFQFCRGRDNYEGIIKCGVHPIYEDKSRRNHDEEDNEENYNPHPHQFGRWRGPILSTSHQWKI